MPYASAAQRGYMHVHHPEIAARWDAEIRKKKGGALARRAKMRRKKK